MKLYLAYGSNMNMSQMKYRCPDAKPMGTTKLANYHLVFRRGVLTIEPQRGSSVPVAVWMISDQDEKNLDRYEGFPRLYYKESFVVSMKRGEYISEAMAYIMTDGYQIQAPGEGYLQTCLQGYRDFEIDSEPLMKAYAESKGGGN